MEQLISDQYRSIFLFPIDLEGAPVTDLPWDSSEPNGGLIDEGCVQAEGLRYSDMRCDYYKICFPCQIKGHNIFRLRGLTSELSEIDTEYIFPLDRMRQGHVVFNGLLGKSLIQYNRENQTWDFLMKQNYQDILIATLNSEENFPLGLNSWTLYGKQNKLNQSDQVLQLKFTKVS